LIMQHRVVVDAIAARRPAAAERAMREHLNAIIADLPAIVLANPELFDEASSSTL